MGEVKAITHCHPPACGRLATFPPRAGEADQATPFFLKNASIFAQASAEALAS
jgi:hypothetical protein